MQGILTPVLQQQAFPRSDRPPEPSATLSIIGHPEKTVLCVFSRIISPRINPVPFLICVKYPDSRASFIQTGLLAWES